VADTIYHIADSNQWERAQTSRYYSHPSLHTEGFIHCSTAQQLEETANLHFAGEDQLLILLINPAKLENELVYESSGRGDFPHIYGPINVEAVERTKKVKRRGKAFKLSFTS
jgi:uncharacterized protein (DUF952 family)